MTKAKTKPKKVVVNLDAKPRKKTIPRTAYTKDNPSPYAFKPGESGNSAGKKRDETRLLSRALTAYLGDRAPDQAGEAVGLPINEGKKGYHYSWAQILAKRILNLAVRGESWAVSEISRLTEPIHSRLDVFSSSETEETRVVRIEFVSSDGDGRPCTEFLDAHPDFVDGRLTLPALSAPED